MRLPRRPLAACLLIGLAATGVAERTAVHAHPLDEEDLVPHQLAIVDPGADCAGGLHFDAARRGDHPVCFECALTAAAVAVGPSTAAGLLDIAPALLVSVAPAEVRESRAERTAPARAPPAA